LKIRLETLSDVPAIHALLVESFPTTAEADLVARLRADGDAVLSLVADAEGGVAGHVLFSRMTAPLGALGLAPVAVAPRWRRQGVAARLIREGLARARAAGWEAVFVLGDPAYYGRFGFDVASAAGFRSPYAGPYFMLRQLTADLPAADGPVDYAPACAALG
jgi:putative acetyltransferase